ncbi:MAG: twin-arginine translocase TatA/TatE family subunit [Actinomycetota bacterium]|nr:twin-arginine translocase TatA/TatE family subunit [Actinomycetota bacterium]
MFRNPLIDAAVVLVVVLLFLGPKRLPELGKGLGRGMREFKDGITGKDDDHDKPALGSAPTDPVARPAAEASTAERRESAEVGPEHKA